MKIIVTKAPRGKAEAKRVIYCRRKGGGGRRRGGREEEGREEGGRGGRREGREKGERREEKSHQSAQTPNSLPQTVSPSPGSRQTARTLRGGRHHTWTSSSSSCMSQ